jgi:hypothetical protein
MADPNQNLKLSQNRSTIVLQGHRAEVRRFTIKGHDRLFKPRTFQVDIEMVDMETVENGWLPEIPPDFIHPVFKEWHEDFCVRDEFHKVLEYLKVMAQREVTPAHIAIITRMDFDNPTQRKMELRRVFIKMSKSLTRYYPLIFIGRDEFSQDEHNEYGYLFREIENTRFLLKCRESRFKMWFEEGG